MTVKIKPATPLPWRADDDEIGSQINSCDEGGESHLAVARLGNLENWVDEICDAGRDDAASEDRDAAYIAHAANAYPKLVEALRTVNRIIYAKGAPLGFNDYFEIRKAAVDTLRELGEEDA